MNKARDWGCLLWVCLQIKCLYISACEREPASKRRYVISFRPLRPIRK